RGQEPAPKNEIAGVVSALTPVPPPSTQDLIGWWQLEGNGKDATAGGHDLSVMNAVPAPGRVGLGMKLDGTACLRTPEWPEATMTGASGVTMMAWVKPDSTFVCPTGPIWLMGKGWDYSMALQCSGPASASPALTG